MFVRKVSLLPIEFGGLKIFDYTGESRLGASVAVIEAPNGSSHSEAWSKRSDKYYLVISGEVDFTLGDEEFSLAAGDFCHVARGKRFSYRNVEEEMARLVLIHTPAFDPGAEAFVG